MGRGEAPYPYTNRPVTEHRPTLVVANIPEGPGLVWVMMITSAGNRPWPGDVAVSDLVTAGPPAPSVVRTAKITTLDASLAAHLGVLPAVDRDGVRTILAYRLPTKQSRCTTDC